MQWTSQLGGQLLQVLSLVGGAEVGEELLKLLLAHPDLLLGEIIAPDVQLLLDTAIREDNPDAALVRTANLGRNH